MSDDDAQTLPLKTLILICQPSVSDPRDFVDIGREILRQAGDVDVNIVGPKATAAEVKPAKWSRPSLRLSCQSLKGHCARIITSTNAVPPMHSVFRDIRRLYKLSREPPTFRELGTSCISSASGAWLNAIANKPDS